MISGTEGAHQHIVESRVKLKDSLRAEVQVERGRQTELPPHGLSDFSWVKLLSRRRCGRRNGRKKGRAGRSVFDVDAALLRQATFHKVVTS